MGKYLTGFTKTVVILIAAAMFAFGGCKIMGADFSRYSVVEMHYNIGVVIAGDTAHVVYTAFYNAEDGFIIERAVRDNNCTKLVLHMPNGGGNVLVMFDVVHTVAALRDSGVHVTTIARGLIASAAVPLFVQGDIRLVQKDAWVMMHPGGWRGNEHLLQPCELELVEAWEVQYARIMAARTNMTEEDVLAIMRNGDGRSGQVFYTAERALELGIATKII